jgi:hypothetical protein
MRNPVTATNRTAEFTPVDHVVEGIWTGAREKVERKVVVMNRRLARLGAPAATVTFGPVVEKSWTDEITGYTSRWTEFETVTVTGSAAKLSGWTPVASLDHTFVTETGDDEAYVSMFPGAVETETELPSVFRNVGPLCGHCNTNRLRKTTVVFVSDTGEWINVGTSCLRDFIGVTPATILWLRDSVTVFDDDDEYRAPPEAYEPDLTDVLRLAVTITAIFGFVRSAEPGSTKDTIFAVLDGRASAREMMEHPEWATSWSASADTAEAIKTWVTDKAETNHNDYIANASLAIRANRAAPRTMGLLASLPFAYSRAMGELAERNAAAGADSVHVGVVGEKMVIRPVTIVKAIRVETMYGTSVRVTGLTSDGNKVTTFGSGDTLFSVEIDDIVEWRGTVKTHNTTNEYGVETEFARVKLLDSPSEVDFTKVAKPGDTIKVNVPRLHDGDDSGEWVYDEDTETLWAKVTKVSKRDDRFVYTTNAPTGFFAGADIEVVDESEVPAWKIPDLELYRRCRNMYLTRPEDSEDRVAAESRVSARHVRRWHEERGIEITDAEVDAIVVDIPAAIERVEMRRTERNDVR